MASGIAPIRLSSLVINRRGPRGNALFGDPEKIVGRLDRFLRDYGIGMGARSHTDTVTLDELTVDKRTGNNRQLNEIFTKAKQQRIDVMLIVICLSRNIS